MNIYVGTIRVTYLRVHENYRADKAFTHDKYLFVSYIIYEIIILLYMGTYTIGQSFVIENGYLLIYYLLTLYYTRMYTYVLYSS